MRRHTAERNIALCTAIAVPLVLVLSGCTAPAQPPATTPTKSNTTPSQDALFEEASAITRSLHAEADRLGFRGGAPELPDSMKQYVAGDLAQVIKSVFQQNWEKKIVLVGDSRIVWTRPDASTFDGSVQTLVACVDGSKGGVQNADGTVTPGGVSVRTYYFKYFDSRLKAFYAKSEPVTSC